MSTYRTPAAFVLVSLIVCISILVQPFSVIGGPRLASAEDGTSEATGTPGGTSEPTGQPTDLPGVTPTATAGTTPTSSPWSTPSPSASAIITPTGTATPPSTTTITPTVTITPTETVSPTPPPTATEPPYVVAEIGPEGGAVVLPDDTGQIDLPAGALTATTRIEVWVRARAGYGPTSLPKIALDVAAHEIDTGAPVLGFQTPATATLYADDLNQYQGENYMPRRLRPAGFTLDSV